MSSRTSKIHRVDPVKPDADAIAHAAGILREGGLVAFPTETVYGLGANGLDTSAVARIFEAKQRPQWNPVILHVCDIADAERLVAGDFSAAERRLLERYWPGPLTLVVSRAESVPDIVTAGGRTVALRSPAHPVAQALIRAAGVPVAAPSANRFMGVSPTSAQHVARSLGGDVDMILDGGSSQVGIESTVCQAAEGRVVILREGGITREMMRAAGFAVGDVGEASDSTTDEELGVEPVVVSPGQHERHYAPDSKLTVVEGDAEFVQRALSEQIATEGVGFIGPREVHDFLVAAGVSDARIIVLASGQLDVRLAKDLYRALHEADERSFRETLLTIPASGPLEAAIRDRLRRASDRWLIGPALD